MWYIYCIEQLQIAIGQELVKVIGWSMHFIIDHWIIS